MSTIPVAVVDGVDVDTVAAAARACPAVADLVGGGPGEVATYLPGRRVLGIRVDPDHVLIQVRSRWGVPAQEVAAQLRKAVAGLVHRPVNLVIADVTDPPGLAAAMDPSTTDTGGRTE